MNEKLNGFYRGKVVKHLSHGMCKVFVKGVHEDSWETDYEMLPDAEQIAPLFGGSVNGNGIFSYPDIGSMVLVGFWNGDQRYPFFYGAIMGGPESAGQYGICNVFKDNDDGAYVHKFVVGRSTITMSQVGCIIIENSAPDPNTNDIKSTTIVMDQSGNLEIKTSKSVRITTEETEIQSSKSIQMYTSEMKIKADSRLQINSPYISFNTKEDTNINGETTSISQDGEDGFQIVSDTIKLNAEEGYIVTNSLTNNQKLL